eukprot:scaffold220407_cov19-Tisochrysis_lutea.AAC.1
MPSCPFSNHTVAFISDGSPGEGALYKHIAEQRHSARRALECYRGGTLPLLGGFYRDVAKDNMVLQSLGVLKGRHTATTWFSKALEHYRGSKLPLLGDCCCDVDQNNMSLIAYGYYEGCVLLTTWYLKQHEECAALCLRVLYVPLLNNLQLEMLLMEIGKWMCLHDVAKFLQPKHRGLICNMPGVYMTRAHCSHSVLYHEGQQPGFLLAQAHKSDYIALTHSANPLLCEGQQPGLLLAQAHKSVYIALTCSADPLLCEGQKPGLSLGRAH